VLCRGIVGGYFKGMNDAPGRKLPKRTQYFFDTFVEAANKTVLHPLDWKRFYHFIYVAYAGRVRLSEDLLREMLRSRGFSQQDAEHLANIYHHGRRILKSRLRLNYFLRWKN
jgi:hypothetical protein